MDGTVSSGRPTADGRRALEAVRLYLKRSLSAGERLLALERLEQSEPDFVRQAVTALESLPDREIVFDEVLLLLKAWAAPSCGDAARREYYLCALPSEDARRQAREGLRASPRCAAREAVVLVTVDCLRGDRLSCAGYGKPTTPTLDAMGAEGVYFPRCYSTAGQTAQSFPGIMLSNFFQNFGRSRVVPEGLTTLAEVMSAHGFHTAAFNAANPHVSHFYGYDRGFDEFCDYLRQENFDHVEETFHDSSERRRRPPTEAELAALWEDCQAHPDVADLLRQLTGREGISLLRMIAQRTRFYPYDAADLVKGAIASLLDGRGGQKRFLWLHLMDLHENITVPFSRLGSFSTVQQFLLNTVLELPLAQDVLTPYAAKYGELYDSAVSYVDMQIEVLGNFLRDFGLWDATLLCVTADHGQELLERGRFGHGYDRLCEALVHVPLIFSGGRAARLDRTRASRPVSTLDIAPTILDACGIGHKPRTFLGFTLNDSSPRLIVGQTFYDGADNRCSDRARRAFELKPFPAPVRQCCKQMIFCIQGGWQVIHDFGSDRMELHRLRSAATDAPDALPDAEAMKRRAQEYLDANYLALEQSSCRGLSARDEQLVEARLRDLGYI